MAITTQKKKAGSLNGILAAAKKLSAEEKQFLKIKLFGNDIINELKAFEAAMKKRQTVVKKKDDEIVAAVKKIRSKNAAK